ncbi:MAG TPA: hypothetical protein VLO10_06490, partial [Candidatus Deferrimicrobium sp.]|nr:hypothetical protein [Candidatus Deferrimicrobium sp.]
RCASLLGGSVKMVGHAQHQGDTATLSVRPTVVRAGHPLHGIDDSENAVLGTSNLAGHVAISGLGAGGDSTASAVVSDIVATAADPHREPPLPTAAITVGDHGAVERGGYVRVRLQPVAEAAQLVLQALEDRGITVEASTLVAAAGDGSQQLALVTGVAPRATLERACETLDSLATVDEVAAVLDSVGPA